MRPTSLDMVRSIEHSLDSYIQPELEAPLAISAAAGMRNLLHHLAVRIEAEPELLFADSADKRSVLGDVAMGLREHSTAMSKSVLSTLADELAATASGSARKTHEFPGLVSLSAENVELKEITDRTIRTLHEHEPLLGKEFSESVLEPVLAQLKRQLEREASCFDLTYTGPIF